MPVVIFGLQVMRYIFDNYKEYLKYVYNSAHAAGKICEIVEMVKNQPRNIPFDYEFNTVDGNMRDIVSVHILLRFF